MATTPDADVLGTRFDGPAPEVGVSKDMIKRGLIVAPLLIAICWVIWGANGAWSSGRVERRRYSEPSSPNRARPSHNSQSSDRA